MGCLESWMLLGAFSGIEGSVLVCIFVPVGCWGDAPRECHLEDAQRRCEEATTALP
jgi:hypothetical protein